MMKQNFMKTCRKLSKIKKIKIGKIVKNRLRIVDQDVKKKKIKTVKNTIKKKLSVSREKMVKFPKRKLRNSDSILAGARSNSKTKKRKKNKNQRRMKVMKL